MRRTHLIGADADAKKGLTLSESSPWDDEPGLLASGAHAALIEMARRQLTERDVGDGPRVRYVNYAGTAKSRKKREHLSRQLGAASSNAIQLTMDLKLFHGDLRTSALPSVGCVILDPWLIRGDENARSEDEVELIYELALAKAHQGLSFVLKNGDEVAFTLTGARCNGGKRGMLLYPRRVKTDRGMEVLR